MKNVLLIQSSPRGASSYSHKVARSVVDDLLSAHPEAAVTVRDQHDNRVLYDNQNFIFRGEFEFANDPRNFFNEEDPAVLRIARSFAESIVSTLINGFGVKNDK